ncbi:MAG: hypothetical protein J7574_21030 [Flavobacterium sp.]|uniref:hypothetical protein n=1 Tax=Flavobacterium sp. TaxID=239 RepID=UPI001B03C870|nr:hypothetical protein [Flavobacterium sp.]MBO9586659.1 hypothetical protein [Flavobacterium sp.]
MKKTVFSIIGLICLLSSCTSDRAEKNIHSNDEGLVCTFDLINTQTNDVFKPDATIIDNPRWEIGQTIKIKFLDGNQTEQEIVKKYANEWTNYANLKFQFVPKEEDAHIRIAFNLGTPGAWSELGARLLLPSPAYTTYQNTPSMRLGPIYDNESSRRTILHEFGHALGLKHEMTNPNATIKWDFPKVYSYYYDLMGLSKEDVDKLIINKPIVNNYSEYDSFSIMHYYVPASLTTDGKGVNEMSILSETDKKSINQWYPFPIKSIVESGERIDRISWTQPKSPNGQYKLDFIAGFLFISDLKDNEIVWSIGNPIYQNSSCFLQTDGNIVIKGSFGTVPALIRTIWTSNTSEYPGATLHLQDDGNLQLIYKGVVKWSSKMGKV